MASSTNFEELFEKYQSEGAKSGLSIVKYCQMYDNKDCSAYAPEVEQSKK